MSTKRISKKHLPLLILGVLLVGFLLSGHIKSPAPVAKTVPPPYYSPDKANSLWVVANKGRALPPDYVPSLSVPAVPLRFASDSPTMQLRTDTVAALQTMFAAAKAQGIELMLSSGYRSYDNQLLTYQSEVKAYGQTVADSESARAGHSEHQTGLAADLEPVSHKCAVADCFADTPEGKWLASNSYKYGFIIRYQKDKVDQTGYRYEPWHVRYLGNYLAKKLYDSNQTMEQYFNLPYYTDYPAQPKTLQL